MAQSDEVKFRINVMANGELVVTDANGKELPELSSSSLAETLTGREVKKASVLPTISVIESNPCWVCIGGRWYYIP